MTDWTEILEWLDKLLLTVFKWKNTSRFWLHVYSNVVYFLGSPRFGVAKYRIRDLIIYRHQKYDTDRVPLEVAAAVKQEIKSHLRLDFLKQYTLHPDYEKDTYNTVVPLLFEVSGDGFDIRLWIVPHFLPEVCEHVREVHVSHGGLPAPEKVKLVSFKYVSNQVLIESIRGDLDIARSEIMLALMAYED